MNLEANSDKLTKRQSLWIIWSCLALAVIPPVVHWVTVARTWHRSVATAVFSYDPIYQANAEQNLRAAKALFRGDPEFSVTQSAEDQTLFSVRARFWSTYDAANYVDSTVGWISNQFKVNNGRRTFRPQEDTKIAETVVGNDVPVAKGEIKPSYMGKFRVISLSPIPPVPAQTDYQSIVSTAMLSGILALLAGSLLWQLLPRVRPPEAYPQIPRTPFFLP